MTDDELKAIEVRSDAATPGPWSADHSRVYRGPDTDGDYNETCLVDSKHQNYYYSHSGIQRDMAFIAHARTDVPQLTRETRKLRARLRSVRDELLAEGRDPQDALVLLLGEALGEVEG